MNISVTGKYLTAYLCVHVRVNPQIYRNPGYIEQPQEQAGPLLGGFTERVQNNTEVKDCRGILSEGEMARDCQ